METLSLQTTLLLGLQDSLASTNLHKQIMMVEPELWELGGKGGGGSARRQLMASPVYTSSPLARTSRFLSPPEPSTADLGSSFLDEHGVCVNLPEATEGRGLGSCHGVWVPLRARRDVHRVW